MRNDWQMAMQWAKDNAMETLTVRERCYRAPKRNATWFYATKDAIVKDYEALGVRRLEI